MKSILKDAGIMDRIHALSMKTYTVEEFKAQYKGKAEEVLCRGGMKLEKKTKGNE